MNIIDKARNKVKAGINGVLKPSATVSPFPTKGQTPKRKQSNKPTAPKVKSNTISSIIKDLREYTDKHPEVIKKTDKMIETDNGPERANHIPVNDVIRIMDEVIVHKHKGTWSARIRSMVFQVNNATTTISMTITDRYGTSIERPGFGAADVHERNRGARAADSIDNAGKMAVASALKKASGLFGLGASMWLREGTPEPTTGGKVGLLRGDAEVISDDVDDSNKETEAERLPDELCNKIKDVQDKYKLTSGDISNIMKENPKTKESDGDTRWLLAGDQEKKVQSLLEAIDEEVNKEDKEREGEEAKP